VQSDYYFFQSSAKLLMLVPWLKLVHYFIPLLPFAILRNVVDVIIFVTGDLKKSYLVVEHTL